MRVENTWLVHALTFVCMRMRGEYVSKYTCERVYVPVCGCKIRKQHVWVYVRLCGENI